MASTACCGKCRRVRPGGRAQEQARLGSARLGSARLGSALNYNSTVQPLPSLIHLNSDIVQTHRDALRIRGRTIDEFISGYNRDGTIARAFEEGAADYLVKPFSATEFTARVGAALRARAATEPFVLGTLVIDYERRRVTVAGREVAFTATEYEVLRWIAFRDRAMIGRRIRGYAWPRRLGVVARDGIEPSTRGFSPHVNADKRLILRDVFQGDSSVSTRLSTHRAATVPHDAPR